MVKNVEAIVLFYLIIHSDNQSQCPLITHYAKKCQTAMLHMGVNFRKYDNPNRQSDREKFPNVPFDDIEFSKNGFSRHVVHIVRELACDYKLYVAIVCFFLLTITKQSHQIYLIN